MAQPTTWDEQWLGGLFCALWFLYSNLSGAQLPLWLRLGKVRTTKVWGADDGDHWGAKRNKTCPRLTKLANLFLLANSWVMPKDFILWPRSWMSCPSLNYVHWTQVWSCWTDLPTLLMCRKLAPYVGCGEDTHTGSTYGDCTPWHSSGQLMLKT